MATQVLGIPLYWISRDWYYAYMAVTKESFGIAVTTLTQWWAPTMIRISGDASVANEMRKTADGRVELNFPERIVMIANHQVYTFERILFKREANMNRSTQTGYIYGGPATPINHTCTATSTLSSKNPSSIYRS